MADRGQDVVELAALGRGVVDVVGDDDRQPELVGQARGLRDEPVVVGQEVVRQLEEEARSSAGRVARARTAPRTAPPTARAPSRSPTRSRRASSPSRQPDSATRPSCARPSSAWREARHGLRPGQVRPRDEPAQAPPADRVAGEQHEMRARAARSPMPRWSSLTGSRWPGSRARSGRGRAGRPSVDERPEPAATRGRPPGRHGAGAAGRRSPAGSGTAASSSSISVPTTPCSPAASAAPRTGPRRTGRGGR